VGIVLLPAGPDRERPQRGTGLPQRELREGGTPGGSSGIPGGILNCRACPENAGKASERPPVCSAGLLILLFFFLAEAAGDHRRLRVS